MSLVDYTAMPGMGTPVETSEREAQAGVIASWQQIGVTLVSTAVDADNTPTTTLRPYLLLGRVTASGKYKEYDPTATDGSQKARGLLLFGAEMLDSSGTAADKAARMMWQGYVKADQVINLDYAARRQLSHRIWFDDGLEDAGEYMPLVQAKATDYTVLETDNNTTFTTKGASGAVNFTLPTLALGLRYTFFNEVDQDMTITAAAANTMVTFNDLDADAIAFTTAGEQVGACVEVFANSDATKWLVKVSLGAETVTPTITT